MNNHIDGAKRPDPFGVQIAIAQVLENVPKFRKFGGYTAYVEDQGLYTEMLPKEIGMYQVPALTYVG
ncbi:hypothetical protein A5320_13120 [Rheinheimera sp. SA_1]|uniref:DUF885 family protein n=1 Tax=Rheinheimera sp. SA_1 TaxID=1827365 RepID=UPI000801C122|nr:DUF885 family protein [Rheinheimera sp. SA_1]OBP14674.1 hypothetical protein A5320_13120 [Rheinheimera sp. SA_1]